MSRTSGAASEDVKRDAKGVERKGPIMQVHERDSVEAVRQELLAQAAARVQYDPKKAEEILQAVRAGEARVAMPRIAAEPTPIQRWAVERSAHFGPVMPAPEVVRHMRSESMSIAFGGTTPTPEQVALLAAAASEPEAANSLLATIGLIVLPLDRDASEAEALRQLIRAELRPLDLETLINAARMLEFAAAHVIGHCPMARLLAAASLLWWAAGQRIAAARALRLPLHYDPTWPLAQRMRDVLRFRERPAWPII